MSSQHATFIALAKRLIPINGRDVSVIVKTRTGESWDPVIIETVAGTYKAISPQFKLEDVESSLVLMTDIMYIFDSDAGNIPSNGLIRDGSQDLDIIYVKPLKVGENLIITKVWARD